jgi:hypothetical protein
MVEAEWYWNVNIAFDPGTRQAGLERVSGSAPKTLLNVASAVALLGFFRRQHDFARITHLLDVIVVHGSGTTDCRQTYGQL